MHTPDQVPDESPFAAPLDDPATPSRPINQTRRNQNTRPAQETPHELDFGTVVVVGFLISFTLVALGIGLVSHVMAAEASRASGLKTFLNHVVGVGMDLAGLSLLVASFRHLMGRPKAGKATAVGLLLFGFSFIALLFVGEMK